MLKKKTKIVLGATALTALSGALNIADEVASNATGIGLCNFGVIKATMRLRMDNIISHATKTKLACCTLATSMAPIIMGAQNILNPETGALAGFGQMVLGVSAAAQSLELLDIFKEEKNGNL